MAAKQVVFGDEARAKIVAGVNQLTHAVRCTLGPKARTVVLQRSFGPPMVINSGVIVAKEIELADPLENMGAQMVREVASKTSDVAGDGTTTATLLAYALVAEGMKHVAAGMNPMDLKRGIDQAVDAVVAELKRLARPCASRTEIAQVADDLRQQRSGDRRHRCQRHGEGRQGGRDHRRGRLRARERAGGRGGHAVRPRLPLAVLHQHARSSASCWRTRSSCSATARSRTGRDAAGAGAGGQGRQTAAAWWPRMSRARRWPRWW